MSGEGRVAIIQDFISFLSEYKGVLVHEKMNILEILCSLQLIDLNIEKLENFNNDNIKSNNNNESEKKNQNNIDKNIHNDKIEKSFLDHLYHNEIVSLKDGVDYTILKTEINYEDFKFFMSKIILSKYWIFRTLKKTVSTNFSLSPDQTLFQVDDMNINIANCIIDSVEMEKKIESIPRTPSKKSVNQIKADAEQVLASVCYFKIFLHKNTHTIHSTSLFFVDKIFFLFLFSFLFHFYFYYLLIIKKIESQI